MKTILNYNGLKKTLCFLLLLFFANSYAVSENGLVTSPDGKIAAVMRLNSEGVAEFSVLFDRKPVMENNRLGIVREDADFSANLVLESVSGTEKVKDNYILFHGKKSKCVYKANRKVFSFKNKEGIALEVIFQVSNDGVAFRYFFPGGESEDVKRIIDETTGFNFKCETRAWIQPIAAAKSGWNAVNPGYEEYYQDNLVTEITFSQPGWAFPALFKSGEYWIALTETAPDRNYCGCRLLHENGSTTFKIGFPQNAEVMPEGALKPESTLPWYSPWRIIVIGDNLATLVGSTLGTDLAKPSVLSDVAFVRPGRSSWSWVLFKDDSTIYSVQKKFVDYASEMGWEYCLVDADWDRKIGYQKMGELCTYAASRNVGILAWYNSAGSWNTTPYTPRDKMLTKESREAEFEILKSLGVKGVKVDFFGGDGQSVMSYYQDIFTDAARYGLMINCHGATLPRGWQRTYPNLVSMESIKGFEYVTFDQSNADKQASHCCVIPFTRNLFDPMDFTPVCFSEVPNIQRRTTNSFELALSVLFLSGIQHYAEVPEGMKKVPEEVRQLLRDIPVSWDETKFIDGYPGSHVIIARRKANTWYVAGINGGQTGKTFSIPLDFIGNSRNRMLITCGKDDRSFEISDKIDSRFLKIVLKSNDGFLYRAIIN